MPRNAHKTVALVGLGDLATDDPQLHNALVTLQNGINAIALDQAALQSDNAKPNGPQNLTATNVGATVQLQWNIDESGPNVTRYVISRAASGSRSSPTTPLFTAAIQQDVVPAQIMCLPVGSKQSWWDKNFSVTDFNQANPNRFTYWVQSLTDGNRLSEPQKASGSPIELLPSGMGQVTQNPKQTSPNKFPNAAWQSNVVAASLAPRGLFQISATTNATPIEVTVGSAHGAATGDLVAISGAGNTHCNGQWPIIVTAATKFTLTGSTANGTSNGGNVSFNYPGQPALPSQFTSDGSSAYHYWCEGGSTAGATALFSSDGATMGTNEIFLPSPTGVGSTQILSPVGLSRFTGGEHYTVSVFARLAPASTPQANTTFRFIVQFEAGGSWFTTSFDGSLLSTTYSRFCSTFVAPDLTGKALGTNVYFLIENIRSGSSGNDVYLRWPMLNTGDFPAIWTDVTDASMGPGTNSSAPTSASTPTYAMAPDGHLEINATYA